MPLEVDGDNPHFSLWPVTSGEHPQLQHRVFSADPWPVIADAIQQRCPEDRRDVALAFHEQAKDFYQAAMDGRILHAKPLLIYYGMLNLAKALILTEDLGPKDYKPHHGLTETIEFPLTQEAKIKLTSQRGIMRPLFSDFARAIGGPGSARGNEYKLEEVFAQILTGHRLWCSAQPARERFVGVESINILFQNGGGIAGPTKDVWVRIRINEGDLAPLGVAKSDVIARASLGEGWKLVTDEDYGIVCLEQNARSYQNSPTEAIESLIGDLRSKLWSSVLIVPPYTKYYLYLPPPTTDRREVLPQLLSMYLIMFFLGSITRYRPHDFGLLVKSRSGSFIEGAVNDIPRQFLYLTASTFFRREIAKAAIV